MATQLPLPAALPPHPTPWGRSRGCCAAKPARPVVKSRCWPSVTAPRSPMAGSDHFLVNHPPAPSSGMHSHGQRGLGVRPDPSSGSSHLQHQPPADASKGSFLISNNLPTGSLSCELPSVGVLIKHVRHCCALSLPFFCQRRALVPLHNTCKGTTTSPVTPRLQPRSAVDLPAEDAAQEGTK